MPQCQGSDDAEERWIEDMFSLVRENIFGADAEKNRQEQKVIIVRVVQQQRDRHTTDVGAQRNNPFAPAEEPMKKHLERAARDNGQKDLRRTAIEAKNRASKNCIQCQEGGEGDSGIRPSGEYPSGSRPHFIRRGCLQPSGELQRGAHTGYEAVGIVFHNDSAAA